jgi:hypothetical protein
LVCNADEIEGRTDKVKGLARRTEFLKKARGCVQSAVNPHCVMAGLVRACPSHQRLFPIAKAWMPGTRPGMAKKDARCVAARPAMTP